MPFPEGATLSVPQCLLEKGGRFSARPPQDLCSSFKGREVVSASRLWLARLSMWPPAPRPRSAAARRAVCPRPSPWWAARGWGALLTPAGPTLSLGCRKPPLPSALSPFPLAELLGDFIFIISPPRSLCVVYVALAPEAGFAPSGFFPPLPIRCQMLPN